MTADARTNRDAPTGGGDPLPGPPPEPDRALGPLLRQLSADGRTLLRQEVALAGLEARQSALALVKEVLLITVGGILLLLGALLLLVFVVLALGRLLGGNYSLSSLIVGGGLVLAGAIVLIVGKQELKRNAIKPRRAIESARETSAWAGSKIKQLKRNVPGSH